MNWTSLIGPTVIATALSSLVAWITTSRRFVVDRELAERKIAADIALAERKFALDVGLGAWKRRYELCEQVLTAFYQAKDAISWARTRVIFHGEGESRPAIEGERECFGKQLNSLYVPVERLNGEREVFSKLRTLQLSFTVHFGRELSAPFLVMAEAHSGIISAAGLLMEMTMDGDSREAPDAFRSVREQLGWGQRPDSTDRKIEDAMAAIEAACKPVLMAKPAA